MSEPRPEFPKVPFKEAIEALKKRGLNLEPTDHWTDLWQEAHQNAFTVARSVGYDILGDIHSSLVKHLEQGGTFREFQQELTPILQQKGWWGVKQTEDGKTVQLGSPRRLRIIYDTNLRVSEAQGMWARQQRLKKTRPYLRYVCVLDSQTRPEHRQWHGLVLPVDHPWWATHYPPNGWRCRCDAEDLSQDDLERFGYEVSPHAPETGYIPWHNPKTGEEMLVPRGIDPGWDYNPGQTRQAWQIAKAAMNKLEKLPPAIGARALPDLASNFPAELLEKDGPVAKAIKTMAKNNFAAWVEKPDYFFPLAVLPQQDAAALQATARIVVISEDTIIKQLSHHPEIKTADYLLVQEVIDKGEKYQKNAQNMIYILNQEGGAVAVVKATRTGEELFLTSFRLMSSDKDRRRRELLRLKGKR